MEKLPYIPNAHPEFIEAVYREYQKDPESVETGWRHFFEGYELALSTDGKAKAGEAPEHVLKEFKVLDLIQAYRTRGHLFTQTNPVRTRRKYQPTLDLENFNLQDKDLETVFHAGTEIGIGPALLRNIVDHLKETYCRSIGAEFMFIRKPGHVWWLKTKMESCKNSPNFTIDEKRHILDKLNQAVVFENFLHTKFVGQKRFSLQGGETLIPGLDAIVEKGSEMGIEEFVIGMPHRGRLNVLANILNKSYEEIFTEFEGEEYAEAVFAGDVKYHIGYTSRVKTQNGKEVQLTLAPNASHLESVNPVVQGIARAKMELNFREDYTRVAPILIHGDAAIAGQGIVYEVIQMSQLPAYHTGGTIHLIINNQLGFTTNYLEGRSSSYCTDVAKVILSPVFHVNADDVESVVYVIQLAMEYRQMFHTDIFIDLLGYRKYGHNEGDEPRFTQPKLYDIIAKHPDPREIYNRKLLQSNSVDRGLAEEMEKKFRDLLQQRFDESKNKKPGTHKTQVVKDKCDESERVPDFDYESPIKTGVSEKKLIEIGKKILTIPEEVKVYRKIRKLYDSQKQKFLKEKIADWAIAEYLAYGTLLNEGISIRIAGQDSVRGTFSHRHAILLDEETEEQYVPLQQVAAANTHFDIYNSLLSEYAALGFEYGYSCATPQTMNIWEAQFGDFANGAQVITDEYISSGEAKWKRMNGLILYIPHGYEGQGPDHSSGRIERYLELCAKGNMVLANCTTPANIFHLLRRHMKIPFRTPLVVFTPKSLLRHHRCISPVKDFVIGEFQTVIDSGHTIKDVKRILMCSGKIYYELLEKKEADKRKDIAIIRLEQVYPLPMKTLNKILKRYRNAREIIWVQEEPENFGVLPYLLREIDMEKFDYVAREESATPATGFHKQHVIEQNEIIEQAFK
jgi:2-oxoglutarate dehydrogenase E1 component